MLIYSDAIPGTPFIKVGEIAFSVDNNTKIFLVDVHIIQNGELALVSNAWTKVYNDALGNKTLAQEIQNRMAMRYSAANKQQEQKLIDILKNGVIYNVKENNNQITLSFFL